MTIVTIIQQLLPLCLMSLTVYHFIKIIRWFYYRSCFLTTFQRIGLPGPKPDFICGNIRLLDRQYLFREFPRWFQQYGNVFGYYRGDRAILVTKDLRLINEIFIKRFRQFPNRLKFMVETFPFSSSVLALRDRKWRKVRRVIAPAFNGTKVCSLDANRAIEQSMTNLLSVIELSYRLENADMVDYIERIDQRNLLVNVNQMSKRFTMDIICRYAFAIDNEDFFHGQPILYRMTEEFFRTSIDNVLVRMTLMVPFLKNVLRVINDYITSGPIIDHLVKYLQQRIIDYEQEANGSNILNQDDQITWVGKNLLDFILHQLKSGHLTKNEAIGNLLVILLAGYETTACTLSFVLFNLAKHLPIQKRLRNELSEQKEQPIKCEYLDRIIYETLRLYPPVIDYVIRECTDESDSDIELFFDENKQPIRIPKNVAIQVPVWIIHHDDEIWPEPHCFNPDRPGLPINSLSSKVDRNRTTFVAFGIGQRSCIGGSLAIAEIRAILAKLIQTYQIKLIQTKDSQNPYEYDTNGLLKVQAVAELIEPSKEIQLIFEKI